MTRKVLELRFQNASGRTVRIAVPDPKEPVDPAAVGRVMNRLVSLGIFTSPGGDLVKAVEARLVTTTQDTWDLAGSA
ncbi:MAG: DUF2922 domain-containing protein [Alicyclobacillaceae bacterium]|nr:DUF2922 domain-containing protein [Alicyclobacillaceae bacterium]